MVPEAAAEAHGAKADSAAAKTSVVAEFGDAEVLDRRALATTVELGFFMLGAS
jgi:hypothetical protein